LSTCVSKWSEIKSPPYVVDWVKNGVKLPFEEEPKGFSKPNPTLSRPEAEFAQEEIGRLVDNGSLVQCDQSDKPKCVSPIFCVPKKNKKFRLVTDLRQLNESCSKRNFQYEDIRTVLDTVQPLDKLVTADIKDGFFHVPVHTEFQTYLGIEFRGKFYKWTCLPFGLSLSPYFFCKTLRPIVGFLRQSGLRVVLYVDDFILCAPDNVIEEHKDFLLKILDSLGIQINFDKSSLNPEYEKEFIGYVINTNHDGHVFIQIPRRRITRLRHDTNLALKKDTISAKKLSCIAGQCISMAKAILPSRLMLRNVYKLLSKRNSWQDILKIDTGTREDLIWWSEALLSWNGRAVSQQCVQEIITTDASSIGWGGFWKDKEAQGLWTPPIACRSSNFRELLAILLTLKTFAPEVQNRVVQIQTDNITAAAYINFQGGSSRPLSNLARRIWNIALNRDITISAKFLAGRLNTQADGLSRRESVHDYKLNPVMFQYLDAVWGPHTVDRCAAITNNQIPRYNSLYWDPETAGVDCLAQQDWGNENNYVCPPFRLIPKIIRKLQVHRATATLIAPKWPNQPWYQTLLQMSVAPPIPIPNLPQTFMPEGNQIPEPRRNKWRILAWRLHGGIVSNP